MAEADHTPVLFDKPFVLSIGPQHGGSATLEVYLRGRGDIALPADVKEIFYFDRHFQRGAGFYASHFYPEDTHIAVMELATTAFDNPEAPARARELLGPDVRLLCPLRHPVVRAYRGYQDFKRYGIVSGDLEDAVQQAPQILFASHYAEHLGRWTEIFGRQALTILIAEEMEISPEHALTALCRALGWPYIPPSQEFLKMLRRNDDHATWYGAVKERLLGKSVKDMRRLEKKKKEMAWLNDRLGTEISKLEAFLDRKLPAWSADYMR